MRISEQQKNDIVSVIKNFCQNSPEIFLVGSRSKDHLKGGDIDILVIVDNETCNKLIDQKIKIINQIQKQKSIDDTKIDLIIGTKESLVNDPFISSLNANKIMLWP